MLHVSLGRIRLKPGASQLRFLWHTVSATLQARLASGNVHVSTQGEGGVTYWSMSVWDSKDAMLRYRNSGSHRRAMRASRALAERVDFRHWEADAIPDWAEARRSFERHLGA